METPVYEFLRRYRKSGAARFHMPGHKGRGPLGWEAWDITEIPGADVLGEASGILARSQENATALFGSGGTYYGTEGSSQCVRAMLTLAPGPGGTVLAARNVHKSFVYGAALLDLQVRWLWPETAGPWLTCAVSPKKLEMALRESDPLPGAVYVTSPDYLGALQPIGALAAVCRRYGVPLLVDNAHGAYLHFLPEPVHPLDQGVDLCCDSAHKTLPVLTGGAYLHVGREGKFTPEAVRRALALFGSTSPSYLTLASLDLCNAWLCDTGPREIAAAARRTASLAAALEQKGWPVETGEPLKLTVHTHGAGCTGTALAQMLHQAGVVCEYADRDVLVLMTGPGNPPEDFARAAEAFPPFRLGLPRRWPFFAPPEQALPLRRAVFAPAETVPVKAAAGRICAAPTAACPPAVPIVVSGERIAPDAIDALEDFGVTEIAVVAQL